MVNLKILDIKNYLLNNDNIHMKYNKKKIFIIGLGYIGLPMLVCLSRQTNLTFAGLKKIIFMVQKKLNQSRTG